MNYIGCFSLVSILLVAPVLALQGKAGEAGMTVPLGVQFVQSTEEFYKNSERDIPLEVSIRVRNDQESVVWHHTKSEAAREGKPVHLHVYGKNLDMYAQLFVMYSEGNYILTVHVQAWVHDSHQQKGIYRNFSKSIIAQKNTPVDIFPLGTQNVNESEENLFASFFTRLFGTKKTVGQTLDSTGGSGVPNDQDFHLSIQITIGE